jgi:hypothetical protein
MMFLGEGPALGFVLLGVACLVVQQVRPRWVWVAGAMFGLAMLTKLIEAFTIAGALGVWFACRWATVGRRSVGEALRLSAALAAPLLLYELTKLVCLGAGGWADHWREFSSFSKQMHRRPPGDDSSVLQILGEQYHLTWASVAFAAAMLAFVLFRFARAAERQRALLPLMLFGAALVHFAYCVKVASHSGRYIWPAPLTLDFAIASSFVLMGARSLAVALAAFAAMFATPMSVVGYVEFHDSYLRRQTLAERRVVLDFLDEHREATVVSQWWGSFYEIAFLLDDGRRWRLANDPDAVAGIDGPVVLNRHFMARNEFYEALTAACERREPELTLYELYLGGRGR